MPRDLPKYVERFRDKGGKVRFYFRRDKKSPRFPLPSNPKSPEFLEAYSAALAGHILAKKDKTGPKAGTLGEMLASYRGSVEFRALRMTTKATYFRLLGNLENEHGARSLALMTRENINRKILYPLSDRPGLQHNTLKLLRVVIRHGLDMGMLQSDPTAKLRRAKLGTIHTWTEDEIAAFEAHWPVGTKQRLAFALMLYTGQRRSDVHRMTWADIEPAGIRVVQQKTGAKLLIALHADLRAVLAIEKRQHITILNTAYGQPFTVGGFSGFMRDAIQLAGLPIECRPHGLRKASGRRLAEAGCTTQEIMAVLGHKSLSQAELYTRGAAQEPLAKSAIQRVEKHNRNKLSQTTRHKIGEYGKREGKSK